MNVASLVDTSPNQTLVNNYVKTNEDVAEGLITVNEKGNNDVISKSQSNEASLVADLTIPNAVSPSKEPTSHDAISKCNVPCEIHPSNPYPFICSVCKQVGHSVCHDCTHDQDYLKTIGILSYEFSTMCQKCLSKKCKKCIFHQQPATYYCFSINCNEVICAVCIEQQQTFSQRQWCCLLQKVCD